MLQATIHKYPDRSVRLFTNASAEHNTDAVGKARAKPQTKTRTAAETIKPTLEQHTANLSKQQTLQKQNFKYHIITMSKCKTMDGSLGSFTLLQRSLIPSKSKWFGEVWSVTKVGPRGNSWIPP